MGAKPSKTQKKVCYYKWEFLRRNPEYRRDYKEFLELCRKEGRDPKNILTRYEFPVKAPEEQIRPKYGIAFLEDPNKKIPLDKIEKNPFWPFFENRGLKKPTWPSILNPLYPKGEPVIRTYAGSYEDKVQALLNMIVDLTYPKAEIMARVKKLVDDAIEERKKLGLDIHKSRKRFTIYDQYLKIWDLRKSGLTLKGIAAKVFPHGLSDSETENDFDLEAYEKRVKELVAQGRMKGLPT